MNRITALGIFCIVTCFYSCSMLKPVTQNSLLQDLSPNDLSKLEGDYEIISTDTSFKTLARALTFTDNKILTSLNHIDQLAKDDYRLNIKALDERHLKIIIYRGSEIVKTKTIKGRLSDNYFHFRMSKLSPFYIILSIYKRQQNRIGLTKNGDLLLDSYESGVLLLVVLPTFGGASDAYNLIFKRK